MVAGLSVIAVLDKRTLSPGIVVDIGDKMLICSIGRQQFSRFPGVFEPDV